jgi:hypothetical protein
MMQAFLSPPSLIKLGAESKERGGRTLRPPRETIVFIFFVLTAKKSGNLQGDQGLVQNEKICARLKTIEKIE